VGGWGGVGWGVGGSEGSEGKVGGAQQCCW
jgi:hypothetical protein